MRAAYAMICTPFLSQLKLALKLFSCPLRVLRSISTCFPPTSCWPISGRFLSDLEATNLKVVGTN